jgi:hypothetical protein
MRPLAVLTPGLLALALTEPGPLSEASQSADGTGQDRPAPLVFSVRVERGLLDGPQSGRLLVLLSKQRNDDLRPGFGAHGMKSPPALGADADNLQDGGVALVTENATCFPLDSVKQLPAGTWFAQPVFLYNRDLNLIDAPGNLYGKVQQVTFDPARGGTVQLALTAKEPPEKLPDDTEHVKYLKLHSPLLSKFHGRPMYLRAGVILPRDFAREPDRRYPLRVHIDGYGSRYTGAGEYMAQGTEFRQTWLADGTPRMLYLHLDGAGPYGDPYQVNSANNGPFGDAVVRELIPHVEKLYRGIGQGHARVLDGASTGGWVSLALQIFYPDDFNGTWSHCPDPVDFRAFELINIYRDDNAYVNDRGFERASTRDLNGDVRVTMRHECGMENVLGRGGSWSRSGKDWCAWNATFGPRGADGQPRPLWHATTGKIDHSLTDHWQRYDLRRVLEGNWGTLGPKLRGKLRIWVGDADEYFLNNAVHLLDDFLRRADPPAEAAITYGPRKGHSWRGLSERQMMEQMAAAVAKGRPR